MKDSLFFQVSFFFALVAVFIGNVQLPQTVPLSILISSVFLIRAFNVRVTLPFVLLLGVLLPGILNLIVAGYFDIERDFVTYLPICYGLFVLLFVGGFTYSKKLNYASVTGVFILCIWILYSFIASPGDAAEYYQFKLSAETPLGRSNYLAVFIGFSLLVSTFWLGWASLILLPAFLLTMSRTGIILMLVFLFFRFILARQYQWKAVCTAIIIMGLFCYYWDQIYYYLYFALEGALSTESINIRLRAWIATIDIIQVNPLFGIARSSYKDALEASVPGENLWDPHNSILHLLVSFGFVGFIFYASYVLVVFRDFYKASLSDRYWKGVCWGYSLILVWSLFEPILLTPGIEILQAYLFVLARKYNASRRFKSSAYGQHAPIATDYADQYRQNGSFSY